MKKALLILSATFFLSGCESFNRDLKSLSADFGNVPREVVLMNYNGDTLETYNTNFISSDSGSSIYFDDEHGKRITISGGIVVSREK